MQIQSTDFDNNSSMPALFTCQGQNFSPALIWNDSPSNTKSFALIMDDPDATMGTWVHWVIFNIPANIHTLPQNFAASGEIVNATNSWGNVGYGGPCPPSGTHRYFFKLYALDTKLNLTADATKEDVLKAMQGHVLQTSELVGLYAKH